MSFKSELEAFTYVENIALANPKDILNVSKISC